MALQPDGKIVVVGSSDYSFVTCFAVSRYNADGSLDDTFGTGGKFTYNIEEYGYCNANSLAIQNDGKIVVAGTYQNGGYIAVIRLTSNGTLDTSFDGDGLALKSLGYGTNVTGLGIASDGKIIVSGYIYINPDHAMAIIQFNSDGSLDTSVGYGSGYVTTTGGDGTWAEDMVIQPDGNIVIAGFTEYISQCDIMLIRHTSSLGYDSNFGSSGQVATDVNFGSNDYINGVALQNDGKIIVTGSSGNNLLVTRYNSNGTLDTSFDSDGFVTTTLGDMGNCVTVQSDGKILIGGRLYQGGINYDFILIRLNVNGSIDTDFGTSRSTSLDFDSGWDEVNGICLSSSKQILVAGRAKESGYNKFGLACYANPSLPVE